MFNLLFSQFCALTYKNAKLTLRRWKSAIIILLCPFICFMLTMVVHWVGDARFKPSSHIRTIPLSVTPEYTEPRIVVQSIESQKGPSCGAVAFVPQNPDFSPTLQQVMQRVAKKFDLNYKKYFKEFATVRDYAEYLADIGGKRFEMVAIFGNPVGKPATTLKDINVFIFANKTTGQAYYDWGDKQDFLSTSIYSDAASSRVMAVQIAIEESLTAEVMGFNNPKFNYTVQRILDEGATQTITVPSVPAPPSNSTKKDPDQRLSTSFGGLFYQMSALGFFMISIGALMEERALGIKNKLGVMGLSEGLYLVSWVMFEIPKATLSLLIFLICGAMSPLWFFKHTDFMALLFVFLMYFFSLFCLAIFICCLCRQRTIAANVAGMLIFLTGMIIEITIEMMSFFSYGTSSPYQSMYFGINKGMSSFVQFLVFIFPQANFGACIGGITTFVAPSLGDHSTSQHFTWSHLYKRVDATDMDSYSVNHFLMNNFWNGIVYLILSWYISHVFAGATGNSQPLWFPILPSFWRGRLRSKKVSKEAMQDMDTTQLKEQESNDHRSIIIHKLSKVFKNKNALKELSMTMNHGEVFSILGHNGAGKTTAINILTGIHAPTHGYAWVFGKSTATEMHEIRRLFGICEQEDILWKELSGWEHLYFFARFRGLTSNASTVAATSELSDLLLTDAGHQPVSTYSGGMRRRLCVAAACVAKPEVLFLDEPTTGMDPLSKKYVWEKVLAYKRDHIVVLTTHSMQEADVLSDNIAILSDGRLRAIGSALFLKNRFGTGYKLHCICAPEQSHPLIEQVKEVSDKAEILAHVADDVTFKVARRERHTIPGVVEVVQQFGTNVQDWGLTNTTLEEVFLKVAFDSKAINVGSDEVKDEHCKLCHQNYTELVTLYTALHAPVEVPDCVCKWCSENFDPNNPSLPPALAIETREELLQPAELETSSSNTNTTQFPQRRTIGVKDPSAFSQSGAIEMHAVEIEDEQRRTEVLAQQTRLQPVFGLIRHKSIPRLGRHKCMTCCLIIFEIVILIGLALALLLGKTLGIWGSTHVDHNRCWMDLPYQTGQDYRAPCNVTAIEEYFIYGMRPLSDAPPKNKSSHSNPYQGRYNRVEYRQPAYYRGVDPALLREKDYGYPASLWFATDDSTFNALDANWPYRHLVPNTTSVPPGTTWPTPALLNGVNDASGNTHQCSTMACLMSQLKQNQLSRKAAGWHTMHDIPDVDLYKKMAATFPQTAAEIAPSFLDGNVEVTFANWIELPWWTRWDNMRKKHHGTTPAGDSLLPNFVYTIFVGQTTTQSENKRNIVISPGNPSSTWGPLWSENNPPANSEWDSYSFWGGFAGRAALFDMFSISSLTSSLWRHKEASKDVGVQTWTANLPRAHEMQQSIVTIPIMLSVCLLPMGVQIFLPMFVSEISADVSTGSVVLMKAMGLRLWQYYLALWAWVMMIETFLGFLFSLLMAMFGLFHYAMMPLMFIVLVAHGHNLVCFAIMLCGLITRPRIALIVSFIWTVIMGPAVAAAVWAATAFSSDGNAPTVMLLLPPMNLAYALLKLELGGGPQVWVSVVFFLWTGLVFALIGGFVFAIRLGLLHTIVATIKNKFSKEPALAAEERSETDDQDVLQMADEVSTLVRGNRPADKALVISRLTKAFPKGRRMLRSGGDKRILDNAFYAVKNVSWYAEHGECFGLLGPNGAGKSTTMHMIEGSLAPTFGTMWVDGYDTQASQSQVCRLLGVCQQDNILWDDLSVASHLSLYASVKGVPKQRLRKHVQQVAEIVRLDGDEFKQTAKQLSGGMKRRLCIGIALTGNPSVLLLDEPTTGLDPESRRVVWDVIHRCREHRCVILTTHSMEEADALCSRIGIMAGGEMRCVGSQLHLKNKFGTGYKLTITLKSDVEPVAAAECCVENLKRVVPVGLSVVNRMGLTTNYNLNAPDINIAAIFSQMDSQEMRRCVADWGLCMCSLDDVFVSVVEGCSTNVR
eukprot:TRINITY_DN60864_c0_g1_i2.p1 TRINITY_DN60864_c0_g1~~TRINITY_DN60864_c0_g1_i2.p1  ORF type:complete len:1967 (-),score=214.38 TRINITY_DN60864_c0_g1_i2:93-5993(-)